MKGTGHKICDVSDAVHPFGCAALNAATKLFVHLRDHHVRGDGALMGPDPGVSLNLRVTRFIKSYGHFLPWRDSLYYLQAQAYWILGNIELHRMTASDEHKQLAVRCADTVLASQTAAGYWHYPQAEWANRVATVEGCFGALSLLEAFNVSGEERYLLGASKWFDYMVNHTGFQVDGQGGLAVNYFNSVGRGMVPNNATLAIWFEEALATLAQSNTFRQHVDRLLSFLERHQMENGEMPYVLQSNCGPGKTHYLCFQYNAFQFLDLAEYFRISRDARALKMMRKLAGFLSEGLTANGDARHDCESESPVLHYFTAAVAAALYHATHLGLGEYTPVAERAGRRLISVQKPNGAFDYSLGDYGLLSDRRSYPRNQAMILRHLLLLAGKGELRIESST